eukprot:COSAG01_NODE_4439_length_5022_cov_8.812919_1_plen_187_part_10
MATPADISGDACGHQPLQAAQKAPIGNGADGTLQVVIARETTLISVDATKLVSDVENVTFQEASSIFCALLAKFATSKDKLRPPEILGACQEVKKELFRVLQAMPTDGSHKSTDIRNNIVKNVLWRLFSDDDWMEYAMYVFCIARRQVSTGHTTSRRNAKLICNGHGVCGTYVPRHCSPIVVWTHSN